jgi:glutathione synthase/RimK-type ligase-like ATP-grasp enzyme
MKKIGILFGMEDTFPHAFVERVNQKAEKGIIAEPVRIDKVMQNELTEYAVIIDRISQDVPFYRAYLKNAALTGTAVINNPFWWSADDKFFNYALAHRVGIPVPRTALIPSKNHPPDTSGESFRNLEYPLNWQEIFDHVGFPAYFKPHDGGGWKHVYKVHDVDEFFEAYAAAGDHVMTLQESIDFTEYYRCYCIGRKHVHIMPYEPRNPHHLRYKADFAPSAAMLEQLETLCIKICTMLGYDFNTIEFAVRDGIPYAIDYMNPAPDADRNSIQEENFEWILKTSASFLIGLAKEGRRMPQEYSWSNFINTDH